MRIRGSRRLAAAPLVALVAGLLAGAGPIDTTPPADPGRPALDTIGSGVAVRHAVSGPLADAPRGTTSPSAANLRERPLRSPGVPLHGSRDAAVQGAASTAAATASGLGFAGVGNGDYGFSPQYAPPDTAGAVGASQYVQWVNVDLAVFDKATGAIATGFPKRGNTIFTALGGPCASNNDGDPVVAYDKVADRWILTQFMVSSTPYAQCVAVSTSNDALGTYNLYQFDFGTDFVDYPKVGVWPDGYYFTWNVWTNGTSWAGAKVCVVNRSEALAGIAAPRILCRQLSTSYGSLLPSDQDGKTPPPAGTPNLLLNYGSNSLNLWRGAVNWETTSFTMTGPTSIPVTSFGAACNGGNCIVQPGTSQKLDSLADRLMYRLAYRNFGDHEALVVSHSVNPGTSASGVRWYELRNATAQTMASATPVVHQQGTYAPDATARWMPSIAMDGSGNIAVGYNASSSSVYPSLRYTGRLASDTTGTLQAETIVKAGTGSQSRNLSRWGDYATMTVDPVDDCTFWFSGEYLKSTGTWNWSTWITSFKFPSCTGSTGGGGGSPTAPSGPIGLGTSVTDGTVRLTWSPPASDGGDPVTAYVVTWSPAVNGSSSSAELSAGTRDYTLTGLTNMTQYSLSVAARNDVGWGPASTTTATPTTVPGQVADLTAATATNGKGVQLSWSATTSPSWTAPTGYRVYRSDTAGGTKVLIGSATGTTYRDTATARGRTYWYQVAAVNPAGEGPRSVEGSAVAR